MMLLRTFIRRTSSAVPLMRKKTKGVKLQDTSFVDMRNVQISGGNGGDGCISFARTGVTEFAGPDGGDGGNGGHVLFQATFEVKSLSHIPTIIKGEAGEKGRNSDCHGQNAKPKILKVPFGTMFKDESGTLVADLSSADESVFIAARGGAGGKGNKFFATPENQTPELCEFGALGEVLKYSIEMSTIAHVGLVGYPNAGKSTILKAVTRARPKVASYPFTTLRPHVGMVLYDDLEQIAIADIPGIIENAHKNRGLGIDFLKHIQRCLCLAYVVDMSSSQPWDELQTLYDEVGHFDPILLERPSIILANKMDLSDSKNNFLKFKQLVGENSPIIPVSAKMGINLKEMLREIRMLYDMHMEISMKKYTETKEASNSWDDWNWNKR